MGSKFFGVYFIAAFSSAFLSVFTAKECEAGQLQGFSKHQKHWIMRLRPDQDPSLEIQNLLKAHQIKAASTVSVVGSLKTAFLRMANQDSATQIDGPLEVVSLSGTGSKDGIHLHISVSDKTGKTLGGHLMPGSKVFTTLEIVLVEFTDIEFARELEPASGYKELILKTSGN
ncbi:MAG: DNA-binding protein [Bdellovibrionales bacterium]|nr:DNA-binding protein [Bdellovibrionales bacterium]